MFNKIFDPQNSFWQAVGRAPYFLALSVLWFVMSLPIVTLVPATIALYDSMARNVRPNNKGVFTRYFRTFVKELPRGMVLSILFAALAYLLFYGYHVLLAYSQVDPGYDTWLLVFQVSLMIPIGLFLWCVTLESRFVYSFGGLLKNTFIFFFAFLLQTLIIVVIFVACVLAAWFYFPLVFFLPALVMFGISFPVETVFAKMTPTPDADTAALE